jgi:uncharacterized damage-inducible protein DinB
MTKRSRRPRPGKPGAKRRAGARAAAKKRARAKLRASRPKQKPKRTAKTRSRFTAPRPISRAAVKPAPRPKRRAKKAAPAPAFPQAAGASGKHRLLFRMVKARASVLAAIQGMSAATADQPFAEGKWSTRETILHLVTRDRARLREMEAALRGVPASWADSDAARQDRENEDDLASLRRLSWEDSVRLLLTTRQQLMEAVESIPETPDEVWEESHPLGWMFHRLPPHDLHHADIIKQWRTGSG